MGRIAAWGAGLRVMDPGLQGPRARALASLCDLKRKGPRRDFDALPPQKLASKPHFLIGKRKLAAILGHLD